MVVKTRDPIEALAEALDLLEQVDLAALRGTSMAHKLRSLTHEVARELENWKADAASEEAELAREAAERDAEARATIERPGNCYCQPNPCPSAQACSEGWGHP
jgi:hypothetical protein